MNVRRPTLFLACTSVAWCLVGASSCSNSGGSPAGSSSDSSTSSAAPVSVGQAMTAQDGKSVTVTGFMPNYKTGNEFESPAAGKECVQVTLALTNGGKDEWSLPLSEVSVVDQAGQKYELTFDCGSSDDISGLVAGGHAAAKMVFEVPQASPLNLTWVPNQFEPAVYQTKLR